MNLENKKQIAIIALAVGLGLIAAALTGNLINTSVKADREQMVKELKKTDAHYQKQIDTLKQEIKTLATRQVALAKRQPGTMQATPSQPAQKPSSLSLKTPPGKRALTVMIDSLSAVGGLVNPGDYVDVLAHMTVPPAPGTALPSEKLTAIIFQNLQIIAVGTSLQSAGSYEIQAKSSALNITFAVDPEEAGLLTFAQKNGKLQLVLRGPQESETEMLQVSSWETLSDYVLDRHGMELVIPRSRALIQPVTGGAPAQAQEIKPYIQIFRGGREL